MFRTYPHTPKRPRIWSTVETTTTNNDDTRFQRPTPRQVQRSHEQTKLASKYRHSEANTCMRWRTVERTNARTPARVCRMYMRRDATCVCVSSIAISARRDASFTCDLARARARTNCVFRSGETAHGPQQHYTTQYGHVVLTRRARSRTPCLLFDTDLFRWCSCVYLRRSSARLWRDCCWLLSCWLLLPKPR